MKAIVIKRKLEPGEIRDIIELIDNSFDYKIIADIDLPEELKLYKAEKYNSEFIPKREIDYKTIKILNDFGDKVINDKSISEHLIFDKAGIWYYQKFKLLHSIRYLFFELFELNYFSEKYEFVDFYTNKNEVRLYKNLPLNSKLHTLNNTSNNKLNYRTIINFLVFFVTRVIIGFFKVNLVEGKKNLIIDHTVRQTCVDISTLKEIKGNYNLTYLFDKLDNDFLILREVSVPKFKTQETFKLNREYFFNSNEKSKRIFSESVIFSAIINYKIYKERKQIESKLINVYKLIQSQNLNPEEDIIYKFLKSFHKTSTFYIYKYLAFKKFFKKNNFKTISSIDENSAIIKTIFDAAKSEGIKTIGIQHGNIHDLHPAYLFTLTDKKNKVMPDYSFIWGKSFKDLLITKGNYLEESIIIVGQIRTDIISVINNQLLRYKGQKLDFKSVLNIKSSNKIILFASQPDRDIDVRYKVAFNVFSSIKDDPEILLMVKLHPAEMNDFKYYEDIANTVGCLNYKILYDYDLYLLLSISDIVLTGFSTVGSEAVYFNKPLIIVDPYKQDIQSYYKNGLAFQAVDDIDLKNLIKDILSGKLKINLNAYENFIDNFAFKIDGKVAERCVNFIKSLD